MSESSTSSVRWRCTRLGCRRDAFGPYPTEEECDTNCNAGALAGGTLTLGVGPYVSEAEEARRAEEAERASAEQERARAEEAERLAAQERARRSAEERETEAAFASVERSPAEFLLNDCWDLRTLAHQHAVEGRIVPFPEEGSLSGEETDAVLARWAEVDPNRFVETVYRYPEALRVEPLPMQIPGDVALDLVEGQRSGGDVQRLYSEGVYFAVIPQDMYDEWWRREGERFGQPYPIVEVIPIDASNSRVLYLIVANSPELRPAARDVLSVSPAALNALDLSPGSYATARLVRVPPACRQGLALVLESLSTQAAEIPEGDEVLGSLLQDALEDHRILQEGQPVVLHVNGLTIPYLIRATYADASPDGRCVRVGVSALPRVTGEVFPLTYRVLQRSEGLPEDGFRALERLVSVPLPSLVPSACATETSASSKRRASVGIPRTTPAKRQRREYEETPSTEEGALGVVTLLEAAAELRRTPVDVLAEAVRGCAVSRFERRPIAGRRGARLYVNVENLAGQAERWLAAVSQPPTEPSAALPSVQVYVLLLGAAVAGVAVFSFAGRRRRLPRFPIGTVTLDLLCVAPEYRGRMYGGLLLDQVEVLVGRWLESAHGTTLEAIRTRPVVSAEPFFLRQGYAPIEGTQFFVKPPLAETSLGPRTKGKEKLPVKEEEEEEEEEEKGDARYLPSAEAVAVSDTARVYPPFGEGAAPRYVVLDEGASQTAYQAFDEGASQTASQAFGEETAALYQAIRSVPPRPYEVFEGAPQQSDERFDGGASAVETDAVARFVPYRGSRPVDVRVLDLRTASEVLGSSPLVLAQSVLETCNGGSVHSRTIEQAQSNLDRALTDPWQHLALVFLSEGRVIGGAGFAVDVEATRRRDVLTLDFLCVEERQRGRGLATQLLAIAEMVGRRWARRTQGIEPVGILVRPSSALAGWFFRRNGYERLEEAPTVLLKIFFRGPRTG